MVISFIQFAVFSFELQFNSLLKFIYSEKATKFCEIFPLLLTTVHTVKSKGKISQEFMAFSEYMNFKVLWTIHHVTKWKIDFEKSKA